MKGWEGQLLQGGGDVDNLQKVAADDEKLDEHLRKETDDSKLHKAASAGQLQQGQQHEAVEEKEVDVNDQLA